MKVVIEIDEGMYEALVFMKNRRPSDLRKSDKVILNGTPLPKGHGRLIDADALEVCPIDITDLPKDKCLMVFLAEDVNNAPTIIEADKESK